MSVVFVCTYIDTDSVDVVSGVSPLGRQVSPLVVSWLG